MGHSSRIDQLLREIAGKGLDRRQMIQRAAALGITASAFSLGRAGAGRLVAAQDSGNPLGIDPTAPLEVVVFDGGDGAPTATFVNDNLYSVLYPDAEIQFTPTQQLQDRYQPAIVDGNPPDVLQNSGDGSFSATTLYTDGLLADLAPLMNAPAYGQEDITFAESLTPGSQLEGVYDGKQYILKIETRVMGLWYNKAKFEEKGWEIPRTWDEMLTLCQVIKDDGEMAPWTHQGLYPYYFRWILDQMIWKAGGWEAQLKLDNLAEDAWTQPVVGQAMDALQALWDNEYFLEGSEALSHTESQTFWAMGEAAFIPCASWLENEMGDVIPEDFEIAVMPTPSLSADDVIPFEGIQVSAGGDYFIFKDGENVEGAMEWLRLLFSKEGGRYHAEHTNPFVAVTGANEGIEMSKGFTTAQDAVDAAGEHTFTVRWPGLYADLSEAASTGMSELLTGQVTSAELCERLQALTDQLREDDSIRKFEITAPASSAPLASPAASPAS